MKSWSISFVPFWSFYCLCHLFHAFLKCFVNCANVVDFVLLYHVTVIQMIQYLFCQGVILLFLDITRKKLCDFRSFEKLFCAAHFVNVSEIGSVCQQMYQNGSKPLVWMYYYIFVVFLNLFFILFLP